LITRRAFITTVAGGLLAAPLAAAAQQPRKVWRVGLFHVGLDHIPPSLDGLREGLKALGYEDGRNIELDFRNLVDEEAASVVAREFVQKKVDLIVAFEPQTVRAAKATTSTIPIVFLHVFDPVADGFVPSLARPGGNLTGFAQFGDFAPKRLEILKTIAPATHQVLVLVAIDDPSAPDSLATLRQAAAALKLELVERPVRDESDIERVFASIKPREFQAVFIAGETLTTKFPSLILRLATERKLPMSMHRKDWAERGALFSYGADYPAMGRDAARLVDRILRGTRPADLPVEQVTKVELVINLKTAKALGLTIPPSLLLRADQIIE
jgi:putative ABC transport system substrate-binding protein